MREFLKTIGSMFCVAAFLWTFLLVQTWYAMENFTNGVTAGILACENIPEPNGVLKANYLGEQANTRQAMQEMWSSDSWQGQ